MNKKAGFFWLAALLVAVAAQPAQAQTAGKSIWDGVYTSAQADRGQRVAQQNCGSCHSPSEWSHSGFLAAWSGRPIKELHTMIRSAMPMDAPGKLTAQQYSDIIAYMLRLGNAPAGETELPAADEELEKINVTRRAQ